MKNGILWTVHNGALRLFCKDACGGYLPAVDSDSNRTARDSAWTMGERAGKAAEIAALQAVRPRHDVDRYREMYGEAAPEVVARSQAIARTYAISKVYPHNASAKGTIAASAVSDSHRLDVYLLHCAASRKRWTRSGGCGARARSGRFNFVSTTSTILALPMACGVLPIRFSTTWMSAASSGDCARCASDMTYASLRIRHWVRVHC